jgi:hypothetical protein
MQIAFTESAEPHGLISTTELAEWLGLDAAGRRQLRGWVRRRLVTPARTDDAGFYSWDAAGVAAVARVREQYLARLSRLAAAVGPPT